MVLKLCRKGVAIRKMPKQNASERLGWAERGEAIGCPGRRTERW